MNHQEACAPTCYRDTDGIIAHSPECPAVHRHPAQLSPQDVLWRTVVERDELREALVAVREDWIAERSDVEKERDELRAKLAVHEEPHGEPIEVKMDDGSWVPGIGLQRGIEERQGQMYCAYHELRWWADLGEWRSVVRGTEQEPGMSDQEREALEEIEKMTSAIGGLSWSKAIGRLIAVRKRAQVALAAETTNACGEPISRLRQFDHLAEQACE